MPTTGPCTDAWLSGQEDARMPTTGRSTDGWLGGQQVPSFARSALNALVRRRAERLLSLALHAEADDFVERHRGLRDDAGRRLVVRNGLATERHVATVAGSLCIRAPRVLVRRGGAAFQSAILPTYARTSRRLAVALPELALGGLGAGDMASGQAVLRALVGPAAAHMPDGVAWRLDATWKAECQGWLDRGLTGTRFSEVWAGQVGDGGAGADRADANASEARIAASANRTSACDDRPGCLAIVGRTADGTAEVIAVGKGFADDRAWWMNVLLDLGRRGLESPLMVTGDVGLGIWAALDARFPDAVQLPFRTCWAMDRTAGWVPGAAEARKSGVRAVEGLGAAETASGEIATPEAGGRNEGPADVEPPATASHPPSPSRARLAAPLPAARLVMVAGWWQRSCGRGGPPPAAHNRHAHGAGWCARDGRRHPSMRSNAAARRARWANWPSRLRMAASANRWTPSGRPFGRWQGATSAGRDASKAPAAA